MGKNKVAQIALGRSPEDEFKDNLRHLSSVSTFLRFLLYLLVTNFFPLYTLHLLLCRDTITCFSLYYQKLEGDTGLFFTDRPKTEIVK